MPNADDLYKQIEVITVLIKDNTREDGSCGFDTKKAAIALELAARAIKESIQKPKNQC